MLSPTKRPRVSTVYCHFRLPAPQLLTAVLYSVSWHSDSTATGRVQLDRDEDRWKRLLGELVFAERRAALARGDVTAHR